MANYVQGIVGIDVVALLGDIIMNYKKHLSTLQIVVMMFFFFFFLLLLLLLFKCVVNSDGNYFQNFAI